MITYKNIELTDGTLVQAYSQNDLEPTDNVPGDSTFEFLEFPDGTKAKVIVFVDDVGNVLKLS